MESIDVVVAEICQLTRTGLKCLLSQLSSSVNIREITRPEKLIPNNIRDNKSLLIISDGFLSACSENVVQALSINPVFAAIVLIINQNSSFTSVLTFDAVIEPSDSEKTICQKIDMVFQQKAPVKHSQSNEGISEREKEVLTLVAKGFTNKEIAENLFISPHTVITHRKNISAKLGIKTIAGLTVFAVINNLITAEEIK